MLTGMALVVSATTALAAPGDADQTFGIAGFVATDLNGADDGHGAAVQHDGKIVVAASSRDGSRFVVLRYSTEGALDTSFSGDGVATTSFGRQASSFASDVAVQPDGTIVAVGATSRRAQRIAVVRYLPDGSLDPSFSGDGKVTTSIRSGGNSAAFAVAIRPDGRIVVAGTSGRSSVGRWDEDVALARYLPDGALDASFSGDGKLTTSFGGTEERATAIAIQADRKIVVAGASSSGSRRGPYRWAVARYLPGGALDGSFARDGRLTTSFGAKGDDWANDLALQPGDGRIVVVGMAESAARSSFGIARYLPDGTLDASFSADGKVRTSFGSLGEQAEGVVIQGDGRIVVAGNRFVEAPDGTWSHVALARYVPGGILDDTFSGDGRARASFSDSKGEYVVDLVLQADGNVVTAGTAFRETYDVMAARFET
jgi:uncharacterized delta-60 repeat protein